jgi:hypothetical protein
VEELEPVWVCCGWRTVDIYLNTSRNSLYSPH